MKIKIYLICAFTEMSIIAAAQNEAVLLLAITATNFF